VSHPRRWQSIRSAALVLVIGLCCCMWSGCRQSGSSTDPIPTAPSAQGQPQQVEPETGPEDSPTAVPVPSSGSNLVWWTTEAFAPSSETAAGQILTDQVAGFVSMNPDVSLQPIIKAAHGKGGILDFLRTASAAAPSVLPDVVTMDTRDLASAVPRQLLQPLAGLLPSELRQDLFPFAVQVGQFQDQWIAVQFEADLQHLVYRQDSVPQPPLTWSELLTGQATYLFPVAGSDDIVSDASLILYLGAGGPYDQSSRLLALSEQPLLDLLTFYRDASRRQLIRPDALAVNNIEASWVAFKSGSGDMTNALVSRYLVDRTAFPDLGYGAIPTSQGGTVTLGSGWALAIVTKDPARQAAAARFVEWLLMPENNAAWARASGYLPTRRSAMPSWGQGDPYADFLAAQMEAARFRPGGAENIDVTQRLQTAIRDVLTANASPEEAVAEAMQAESS